MTKDEVIETIKKSGLRGRGGAGFPTGNKWEFTKNAEGKLVALAISMPSLAHAVQKGRGYLFPLGWWYLVKSMYLKHEDALELMLIAVDPEYRNKGVHAMLFNELIPNLIQGGFKYGESNAEMETNNKVQNLWNLYEKEFKRRRRVFSKEI